MYFIVSHFYHDEPPAREIGQPLHVHLTVIKLYLYLYLCEFFFSAVLISMNCFKGPVNRMIVKLGNSH